MNAVELHAEGDPHKHLAWSEATAEIVVTDADNELPDGLALRGEQTLHTPSGTFRCTTAFGHYVLLCARFSAEHASHITGIPQAQIEATAHLL